MGLSADIMYAIPSSVTEEEFGRYFEKSIEKPEYHLWLYSPTKEWLSRLANVLKKGPMGMYGEDEIIDMFKDVCIEVKRNEEGWELADSFNQPGISVLWSPELLSSLFPNAEIKCEAYREIDGGYCDCYKAVYLNGKLLKVLEDVSAEEQLKEDMEEYAKEMEAKGKPLIENTGRSDAYEIQDIETYHDAFMKYE